jgi:hypothetical protein
MNWTELTKPLRPLAAQLEEQLCRQEFRDAEVTASRLADLINDLYRSAIKMQIVSGIGYK